MAFKFRSLQLLLPLACVLLAGCANMPTNKQPPSALLTTKDFRVMREKEMQFIWVGQPYEDLVYEFGKPRMIMGLPASRPWKVSVIVYEGLDPDSNCIDAFTVVHSGKPVVDDYFCR